MGGAEIDEKTWAEIMNDCDNNKSGMVYTNINEKIMFKFRYRKLNLLICGRRNSFEKKEPVLIRFFENKIKNFLKLMKRKKNNFFFF